MAELTDTAGIITRKTVALGPIKIEMLNLETPATGDTVSTRLTRAEFVFSSASTVTGDVVNSSAVVEADGRTITLGTSGGTTNVALLVIGF